MLLCPVELGAYVFRRLRALLYFNIESSSHNCEKCLINLKARTRRCLEVTLQAIQGTDRLSLLCRHGSCRLLIYFVTDQDDIILCLQGAFGSKVLNVLVNDFEALSFSEIENNDCSPASPKVLPCKCKEGFLSRGIPNLHPYCCLVHLQRY